MVFETLRTLLGQSRRLLGNTPTILILDLKRRLTLPVSLVSARQGDDFEADFDAEEDAVVSRRLAKGKDWLSVMKDSSVAMDDIPVCSKDCFKSKL